MAKDSKGGETIESIAGAGATGEAGQQQQLQIQLDDSQTSSLYSSNVRVWNSAEEFNVDFGGPLRQTGASAALIKIEQRVVLSPWAAKRLAIQLTQAVQKYEQVYGTLEIDPRRRTVSRPVGTTA